MDERCYPDNLIGPDVTAIIGRLAAVASGRYALPPPPGTAYYGAPPRYAAPAPPAAPTREGEWRARIMAEARRFCAAFPADEVCNKPDEPPR